MYIEPQWRILTVGDGDLSFSASLHQHYQPRQLTATVLDAHTTLEQKYGGDSYLQQLRTGQRQVLTEFDITRPQTWSDVAKQQFDLVIFQFPLIPGFASQADFKAQCDGVSINVLNRRLLRHFLINACEQLLDPQGPQLCYITSKDVKPYCEWNIESSLNQGTAIHYQGAMDFDIGKFPGYRIRNVDRDKHVKDTQGITYVWSPRAAEQLPTALRHQLVQPLTLGEDCCHYCQAGPFTSEQHRQAHESSQKHRRMSQFEQQWQADLSA